MDDLYYLTDYDATKIYEELDKLQEDLRTMAGDDDKATVNVWWLLCRIREIHHSVVWGFSSPEEQKENE